MLKVSGVDVFYGNIHATRSISLEVGAGEFVAILGPNGAGKSTLLKAIAGVHRQRAGTITLDGGNVDELGTAARIRRGLGAIPEGRQLFPDMTVRENLILGGYARLGVRITRAVESELDGLFDLFPRLRERREQLAGSLSGGDRPGTTASPRDAEHTSPAARARHHGPDGRPERPRIASSCRPWLRHGHRADRCRRHERGPDGRHTAPCGLPGRQRWHAMTHPRYSMGRRIALGCDDTAK